MYLLINAENVVTQIRSNRSTVDQKYINENIVEIEKFHENNGFVTNKLRFDFV